MSDGPSIPPEGLPVVQPQAADSTPTAPGKDTRGGMLRPDPQPDGVGQSLATGMDGLKIRVEHTGLPLTRAEEVAAAREEAYRAGQEDMAEELAKKAADDIIERAERKVEEAERRAYLADLEYQKITMESALERHKKLREAVAGNVEAEGFVDIDITDNERRLAEIIKDTEALLPQMDVDTRHRYGMYRGDDYGGEDELPGNATDERIAQIGADEFARPPAPEPLPVAPEPQAQARQRWRLWRTRKK